MKVLLVSSNVATSPYPVYPLGMSMVAAAARDAGHEVMLFDYLDSGKSLDAFADRIRTFQPNIIGVSIRNIDNVNLVHEERYLNNALLIVERARRESDAKIVLGGPAFSILPKRILEYTGADYGVVGEGEEVFKQFLNSAEKGEYPPRGTIISGEASLEGDAIPSAIYDRGIIAHYMERGSIASIQTKRGCPLKCVYCSYPALEGGAIRPRNPKRVVDDIETLVNDHGVRYVFFTDNVFNDDQGSYLDVLREMEAREVKVSWSAFLKPSGLTPDIVDLMKRTGVGAAELGTDAACDTALKGQRKPFNWSDVVETNGMLMGAKIPTAHYFMFGGPGETPDTVREGVENLRNLKCSAAFVFMGIRILPDTVLRDIAISEGVIGEDEDLFDPVYYISQKLDREWLEEYLTESFKDVRYVLFPPDSFDDKLQLLYKLGYHGSLWELLDPSLTRARKKG